jgi:formylglycine-generating enzyme required for sulfatase activity
MVSRSRPPGRARPGARRARWLAAAAALLASFGFAAGCNAIFGIREGTLDTSGAGAQPPFDAADAPGEAQSEADTSLDATPDGGPEADAGLDTPGKTDADAAGDGADAGDAGIDPTEMITIPSQGQTVTFTFDPPADSDAGSQVVTLSFSRSFWIDRYEVTVGRFKQWVQFGGLPCGGGPACSLDQGGPYQDRMMWNPAWNAWASDKASFTKGHGCQPSPQQYGHYSTYEAGDPLLPMTCVSWYQAAAFCAFENKRLVTEMEWQFVAAGHEQDRFYPFSVTEIPLTCNLVTYLGPGGNLCGFPVRAGTAAGGGSRDGVFDLSGSVFEWVWDIAANLPATQETDYTGPAAEDPDAGLGDDSRRVRRGGAFLSDQGERTLTNRGREVEFPATLIYNDVGFRCARTIQ